VHHSITYVCQPGSDAEAEAKQLMAGNGTGPYNLDTHVKRCAQLYMVWIASLDDARVPHSCLRKPQLSPQHLL
jgi:hypothetical protein